MGYSQKRKGRDGRPRYTAVYEDIRGKRHSAGTFASRKDADEAWQRAEVKVAEGRPQIRVAGARPSGAMSKTNGFPITSWKHAPARTTPTISTVTSSRGSAPCG